MKLIEITQKHKTTPGEYIFHNPTEQIVLCGSFNRDSGTIRAFVNGSLFSDKIENFRKIEVMVGEGRVVHRCKGCGR